MKARWIVAIALGALLLLAGIGVAAVSWQSAQKLVHPVRETITETPANVNLPYENVSFRADGLALSGWWMPAPEPRGVVIFLHGYGDSKQQALPLAPFLHNASYDVLAFDFRAHGESAGDHTTVGMDEVDDVLAAIELAKQKDPVAAQHLALLGYSMGAATAINTAAKSADVDVVVSDSAFATLTNIASNSITHFTDLPKYPFGPLSVVFAGWIVGKDVSENAPVRAIHDATAPVLVIQGLADDIAFPHDDGEAIAAAAPAGSQLWLVPNAHHVESHTLATTEYEARVTEFIDQSFSG